SFRTLGVQSRFVKFTTLLFHFRFLEWMEAYKILPPSQNGFRPGYRTANNVLILRCLIDKAKATGKTLYVATVDLTNAFPSTDRATLWLKLYRLGVRGKIFD
ncbi:hypothetical protein AURDEDRAFT_33865, partial [Auricularia subglabra TFB-10046 SS5]